jgi:hypothetical protein
VRIRQDSHHTAPPLNLKKHANPASAARPAQGLVPAVIPFLDALAELGARAVLADLEREQSTSDLPDKPRLVFRSRSQLAEKPEFHPKPLRPRLRIASCR